MTSPTFDKITINDNNNQLTLTFSDAVYKNNMTNVPLSLNNFNLSITGGNAIISSFNSIETTDNTMFLLNFTLSNLLGNGQEVLSVTPINVSNENGIVKSAGRKINVKETPLDQNAFATGKASTTGGYSNTWDDTNDVKKSSSMVLPLFKFIDKNNFINSGERTKRLANKNIIKSISSNSRSKTTKLDTDNQIIKFNNHSNMIRISKGFSLLYKKNCNTEKETECKSLCDSNSTVEDYHQYKRLGGSTDNSNILNDIKRGYQIDIPIDKCRIASGLLNSPAKFGTNKYKKKLNFYLHKNMTLVKCNDSIDLNEHNKPDIHNIKEKKHIHWFPVSREEEGATFGYYVHDHESKPHSENGVPDYYYNHYIDRFARFPMNFYNRK
jgi:hypothetical protein